MHIFIYSVLTTSYDVWQVFACKYTFLLCANVIRTFSFRSLSTFSKVRLNFSFRFLLLYCHFLAYMQMLILWIKLHMHFILPRWVFFRCKLNSNDKKMCHSFFSLNSIIWIRTFWRSLWREIANLNPNADSFTNVLNDIYGNFASVIFIMCAILFEILFVENMWNKLKRKKTK